MGIFEILVCKVNCCFRIRKRKFLIKGLKIPLNRESEVELLLKWISGPLCNFEPIISSETVGELFIREPLTSAFSPPLFFLIVKLAITGNQASLLSFFFFFFLSEVIIPNKQIETRSWAAESSCVRSALKFFVGEDEA